jgi:hypothetical protein
VPKQCERPGCSALAEVLYGFDPGRLLVWLEQGVVPEGLQSNALCRRHADALAVPKGWSIDDRRESVPRLFSAPKSASNIVKFASSRSHKRKRPGAHESRLFDAPPEGELEETKAIPWTVDFDLDDDLDGVLHARGRLLSRAFGLSDATKNAIRPEIKPTPPEPPATAD